MSTILERCDKWMEVNRGCFTQIQDALIKFATAERELQRQECAEAYRDTANDNQHSCFIQSVYESILTAGTDPTNPYGCACDWKRDNHHGRHILWSGEVYFYSTSCNHCPACGAKRRET